MLRFFLLWCLFLPSFAALPAVSMLQGKEFSSSSPEAEDLLATFSLIGDSTKTPFILRITFDTCNELEDAHGEMLSLTDLNLKYYKTELQAWETIDLELGRQLRSGKSLRRNKNSRQDKDSRADRVSRQDKNSIADRISRQDKNSRADRISRQDKDSRADRISGQDKDSRADRNSRQDKDLKSDKNPRKGKRMRNCMYNIEFYEDIQEIYEMEIYASLNKQSSSAGTFYGNASFNILPKP